MTGRLVQVLLLTTVYLLVLASSDWRDAVIGVLLSFMVLAVTASFRKTGDVAPRPMGIRRIVRFFPFAVAVLADVVKGSFSVSLYVLGFRSTDAAGIVRVPYLDRTPQGIVVSGLVMTLSPGTVLVDLDDEQREMIVHAIDASDPEGVISGLQEFYQRHQRQVFP
jgi:multisubunit Na+/H+ antiporter MnhE subunit